MRTAAVLVVLLFLAGCASRGEPPERIYILDPGTILQGIEPEPPRTAEVLKLAPLRGTRPFAGTRMLYTENGIEQNGYAWSRWSDSPLAMLQAQLVEGLNRAGLFRAVLPPAAPLRGSLVLEGTLLDFSLHAGENPAAVVEIRFLLLDGRRTKVLASRLLRARVPVERPSPVATAKALNRATRLVLLELIGWLKKETASLRPQ